jgi:hypothetical protein
MSVDSGFFSVHLQSLERFAVELETQLDGMRRPSERLAALAEQELPMGAFNEAYSLTLCELTTAEQMYALLQAVREAVGFAGEVTRTIAAAYQNFDQQAAAALGSPSTPGPIAQGPVTYSDPAKAPLFTVSSGG